MYDNRVGRVADSVSSKGTWVGKTPGEKKQIIMLPLSVSEDLWRSKSKDLGVLI
jgi:hypothetical protein